MADATSKGPDARPKGRQKGRWLPVIVAFAAAAIIGGIAYFGLKFFRDTAYADERAFRVLGQIVGQFANFQSAIDGTFRLVRENAGGSADSANAQATSKYQRAIALRDVTVKLLDSCPSTEIGSEPSFRIEMQASARNFSMVSCEKSTRPLELSGALAKQLPIFIVQDHFDNVVIATENGSILAGVPRGEYRGNQVELHEVAATDLLGGSAAELLRRAAVAEHSDPSRPDQKSPTPESPPPHPDHAVVLAEEIGGQTNRVFVLPFEPAQPVWINESSKPEPRLYLIAFKKQRVMASLSEALGSGGALVVTFCALFGILAWPLLSLRFESPRQAIPPTQVAAVLIAILLMPAVIATAGFSVWTRHRLELWADQHAEIYALRVEDVLIRELDSGVHILEELSGQYGGNEHFTEAKFLIGGEKGPPRGSNVVCVQRPSAQETDPGCKYPIQWPEPPDTPGNWSWIRSVAPLNKYGKSAGLTLNFFEQTPTVAVDVHDRPYFQALMQREEWVVPDDLWHERGDPARAPHRYVAQRLFNRTDAARVLQLAVPLDRGGERLGIVTGDTRVYGLANALRPPLLRFAIADSRSGALLFHSKDRLSLAENLLVETEQNATLEVAMQQRASRFTSLKIRTEQHFSGRYLGKPHRFFYRAVAGAPWTLVVFYPTDGLNDMVLQTAVATLGTYFALVIFCALLLVVLTLILPDRFDLQLLKWIWPKWESRHRYPLIAPVLIALVLASALVLLMRLARFDWIWIIAALSSGFMLLAGLDFRRYFLRKTTTEHDVSVASFQRSYLLCLTATLLLLSALPAVLLGIGYHDTSVRAVLREELMGTGSDELERRRAFERDQQHFGDARSEDPTRLSESLPVPGYTFEPGARSRTWLLSDVAPTPWLEECGPPMLDSFRRSIWSMSTARQVQRPLVAESTMDDPVAPGRGRELSPCGSSRVAATRTAGPRPRNAVQAWQAREDGTTTRFAIPLHRQPSDLPALVVCERNGGGVCRDVDLDSRYAAGSDFGFAADVALGSVLLVSLLAALVSRRLLGVRVPFAGRFTPTLADREHASRLLDAELELVQLKKLNQGLMTSKDEADWRAVRCLPVYEQMWDALTTDEQMLLHQMASHRFANPENQSVIERLLRRGYLTLAPWPRIVEPGFEAFVRSVQPDALLEALEYETTNTVWAQLRTPLLFIVVVIAALLMWLAGSTMHLVAGTLAGVAALFSSVTQVTNFIQRDRPSASR